MLALIIATWFTSAAAFPLNPVEEDTLNYINLHLTVGLSSPNQLTLSGPEVSVKYETLIHHPYVIRAAFDYKYGEMQNMHYPKGDFHGTTYSIEGLYYRGTSQLTGYVGLGVIYSKNFLKPYQSVSDSLLVNENISDVSMSGRIGYRLTLGLRIQRNFSVEIGLTDTRPRMLTTTQLSENQYMINREVMRLQEVRITVGYLLTVIL